MDVVSYKMMRIWLEDITQYSNQTPEKWFVEHYEAMLLCVRCLTAPQGPVRHRWDWLRGRLFLVLVFGEDGNGRDSLERDGH